MYSSSVNQQQIKIDTYPNPQNKDLVPNQKVAEKLDSGRYHQIAGGVLIGAGVTITVVAAAILLAMLVPKVGTAISNAHNTGATTMSFFATHNTLVIALSSAGVITGIGCVVFGAKSLHYYYVGAPKERREHNAMVDARQDIVRDLKAMNAKILTLTDEVLLQNARNSEEMILKGFSALQKDLLDFDTRLLNLKQEIVQLEKTRQTRHLDIKELQELSKLKPDDKEVKAALALAHTEDNVDRVRYEACVDKAKELTKLKYQFEIQLKNSEEKVSIIVNLESRVSDLKEKIEKNKIEFNQITNNKERLYQEGIVELKDNHKLELEHTSRVAAHAAEVKYRDVLQQNRDNAENLLKELDAIHNIYKPMIVELKKELSDLTNLKTAVELQLKTVKEQNKEVNIKLGKLQVNHEELGKKYKELDGAYTRVDKEAQTLHNEKLVALNEKKVALDDVRKANEILDRVVPLADQVPGLKNDNQIQGEKIFALQQKMLLINEKAAQVATAEGEVAKLKGSEALWNSKLNDLKPKELALETKIKKLQDELNKANAAKDDVNAKSYQTSLDKSNGKLVDVKKQIVHLEAAVTDNKKKLATADDLFGKLFNDYNKLIKV